MSVDVALGRAIDAARALAGPHPPWNDLLESTRQLIGGDGATFIVFEGFKLASFKSIGNDENGTQAYQQHFAPQDIMLSPEHPRAAGTWLDTEERLSLMDRGRNAYYVDFMCRYRVRQMLSLVIEEGPARAVSLSVQRNDIRADTRAQLNGAPVTAFRKAMLEGIEARRQASAQWLQAIEAASSGFGEGLLLVNGRRHLVHASPTARQLLADAACDLRLCHGRLWHPEARISDALDRALSQTLQSRLPSRLSLHGAGERICRLEFALAPPQLRWGDESLVLVRMRMQQAPLCAESLCMAYGLTLAEARVLCALAAGETPASHAQVQRVSIHTVRKQIATLMEKMGCCRQADLVRKALAFG